MALAAFEWCLLNTKLIKILKYLALIGISTCLLLLTFRGIDFKKFVEEMLHASMFWVAISGVIAFGVRAHLWVLLIKPSVYCASLKNTTYYCQYFKQTG